MSVVPMITTTTNHSGTEKLAPDNELELTVLEKKQLATSTKA